MKRSIGVALLPPRLALGRNVPIRIDTDRVIDQVDPRICGVFVEPIGRNRPEGRANALHGPNCTHQ